MKRRYIIQKKYREFNASQRPKPRVQSVTVGFLKVMPSFLDAEVEHALKYQPVL